MGGALCLLIIKKTLTVFLIPSVSADFDDEVELAVFELAYRGDDGLVGVEGLAGVFVALPNELLDERAIEIEIRELLNKADLFASCCK